MKINLKQVIVNVNGVPLTKEEPIPGTRQRILREIANLRDLSNANVLKEAILRWQTGLKENREENMTIRDYFLTLLGRKFDLKDKKRESFWTIDIGIACSKDEVLDISGEQLEFIKRIFENNKIKEPQPMGGEREIELFFPYELGQVLKILDGQGEPVVETKKEKTKQAKE